ncbi:MAG: Asp-tRNA(Asn)/Glu-tRNA(Gln) amidotransferase subunit GatA [Aquificaceae bacterium]|nr:Asp-tRNA(Asn)/Glu-tRNA(Gln) amidotransferase subunit GatA [Aquificaceae bacterium]MCX7989702.1 Asp-tRNA(Asn)/Glu-tRNA(Gln) amidotransferase subunit GatA [Aquificaceae bacterium]MDW8033123.1 Asp-tRNA(Asn)/Glu-tRNA(Gln) amidotransferase subunit GatA [Aquificaceae bacterium]MDW8294135.1 Asp-tRNA(Asn)/Glu-tRNA(Gln) amidotransferase subunit GatA [Aquificaceae bacterium]
MLWKKSALELVELLRKGEIKPKEVLESFFERFTQTEEKVRAYITPLYEKALQEAENLKVSEEMPLAGVPVAIKDNINVLGHPTTCASKILQGYVSPYDATVVERLKRAGAIVVGKTNMDEFAMGSSTEYSAFFKTRNPWDLERVPGGSSGGSAVAVAVQSSPLSLGSDTGGSIRQPASFCGVIGLKPTYGRVSRYGLVAFASSLDQIGPFGRRTEDVALIMEVISGHDPRDSTSSKRPVPKFREEVKKEIKGLRIGYVREFMEGLEEGVSSAFQNFLRELQKEGCEVEEVSLPHVKHSIPCYYIIAPSEASSNLARYDGVRFGFRAKEYRDLFDMYSKTRDEGFGPEVKRRILLGTFALSAGYYDAYYLKAMKVRRLIAQDFERVFEKVDLVATPTSPSPAFKFGEKTSDPISMYLSDIFTVSVNLAGLPGISIPVGLSGGLPVGGQLIGRAFDEATLLRVSYWWEQIYKHYQIEPPL